MRFLRRAHLTCALLLLVAVACGSKDKPAPAAAPADATTTIASVPLTTVTAKPAVALESAGAQPRQPLVLHLTAGTTTKMAMVSKLGLKMSVDGKALPVGVVPGTRTVMEQRIDRVDADGTARFTMTVVDISVVATAGADPAAVQATEKGIQALRGLKGTGAVDVHGTVSGVAFDTNAVSEPTLKGLLDSLTSQVGNFSAPFPSEAVGVGATWSVASGASIAGLKMTTTTHYTLRSRTGDRYELDTTQEAAATPGPAEFPGLPAGASASVTSFAVRSTGHISGELTRYLPTAISSTGSGDGTFVMTASGQKATLAQQLTIELTAAPA